MGPNFGLNSDLIGHEEKKLSRALANEFKSTILAKKNSTLPNRSSIECNSEDSKLSSKNLFTGNNVADVNFEKLSTTSEPFHYHRKDDDMGMHIDGSDKEIDRNVSFNERTHQSTLVSTVATESSKRSWHCNISEDDDDDNSDEWFNRAVSSKTPRNVESITAVTFKSSKLPSFQNFNESSVKETIKDVFIADSKTVIDCTPSIKEKSVCVIPQSEKTPIEVENVEKKYSIFGSGGDNDDDDDDDYLFTKKAIIASDKNKTNELYEILFNDSDIDDPIQALVEENKRRVEVNRSTEYEIFDDSEIINKPAKDSEISDENYSSSLINDYENMLPNTQLIISSDEEMLNTENESVGTTNINSSFADPALDVSYGTKGKLSASHVTETHESILSEKIIPKVEAKEIFSDDFLVSDIHLRKNETNKISHTNVQIPEFYDVNFEKEEISTDNVESGSSESVLKSNSSAVKMNALDLSAETAQNLKSGLDFLQMNSDEPTMKTVEKKKFQFKNLSSSLANPVTCEENDEDRQQSCLQKNTNDLLEPSIYRFGSKNSGTKTSISMKNQVLPDSALISDFRNQKKQSPSSILSQTSSNFCCDEFSTDASNNVEKAISPFSENGSVTSEIIIYSDNITKLNGGNSCEQNIVKEETPSCLKTTKPGTFISSANQQTCF